MNHHGMIGYKIARRYKYVPRQTNNFENYALITLQIPEEAVVFAPYGHKCRTNMAYVSRITDLYGNSLNRAFSGYKMDFSYYVGDFFNIKNFDMDSSRECSTGIHFFSTKTDAIDYIDPWIRHMCPCLISSIIRFDIGF